MSKDNFSSSAEVFSWLTQFVNLESGQTPKSFRLDRMEVLAELAGHPERIAPAIHIAGSKGKGSLTGMIAAVLEADGRRVARYMSPHVSNIRERITLGNEFFDEQIYCAAGDELREIAEEKLPAVNNALFDPACEDGEKPTYFELLTLFFFLCARHSHCDVLVVETGMGGRLDSTNIVDPLVSVITIIELEHTQFLGSTLEAVAGEKAGIIKPGKPLILAKQKEEALHVFQKKAAALHSPLIYFPDVAEITGLKVHPDGTDFTLNFLADSGSGAFRGTPAIECSIPIPGAVQAENAALAVIALKTAFLDIGADAIRRGLRNVNIPARFEKIASDPVVIIDGAHTPESAALCAATFCSLYGEGGIVLFGCAAGKNVLQMAEVLLPHFSQVIITTPGTFKISEPEKVYNTFAESCGGAGREKTIFVKDTVQAIQQALETSRQKKLPLLVTGSFFLAGEVREFICEEFSQRHGGTKAQRGEP